MVKGLCQARPRVRSTQCWFSIQFEAGIEDKSGGAVEGVGFMAWRLGFTFPEKLVRLFAVYLKLDSWIMVFVFGDGISL